MQPTKQELLDHYASKELKRFIQFDVEWVDSHSDEDCDCGCKGVLTSNTYELMWGRPVRVLAEPDQSPAEILQGLHKIVKLLKAAGRLPQSGENPIGNSVVARQRGERH